MKRRLKSEAKVLGCTLLLLDVSTAYWTGVTPIYSFRVVQDTPHASHVRSPSPWTCPTEKRLIAHCVVRRDSRNKHRRKRLKIENSVGSADGGREDRGAFMKGVEGGTEMDESATSTGGEVSKSADIDARIPEAEGMPDESRVREASLKDSGGVSVERLAFEELGTREVDRLFSALEPCDVSGFRHKPGSLLDATALIGGTAVGAGILALPAATLQAGLLPSSVGLVLM